MKSGTRAITLLLGALLALTMAMAVPADAREPSALTVWVSPEGSDANDGLSPGTPFATLQRASDWLCGSPACPGRDRPVIVRLAQKTFRMAASPEHLPYNGGDAAPISATLSVDWHYFDPSYTTTLEPWNYQPGDHWPEVAASGGYPTFDGRFTLDSGFNFTPRTAMRGRSTGLRFLYTRWQRYTVAAIVLSGGLSTEVTKDGVTVQTETGYTAGGVTFYGNYFTDIGNAWHPDRHLGYGAILPNNSPGNIFRNNHFVRLMNTPKRSDTIHIHAIYSSHASSNAVIDGNEFRDITGDPVRQRDRSHGIKVTRNTFTRAGAFSYFDDYYCKPSAPVSYCNPKEYRSYGGVFAGNNILRGTYPQRITGRRPVFCFDQPAGLCPANRIAVPR